MFFPMFFYDYTMVLLLPAIALAMYAQAKVQGTFRRYSQVMAKNRLSGAEVARDMLRGSHIHDVRVERTQGRLSDHYDPRTKTLRLSEAVYSSNSLAALGVAAHEVGHAIQHHAGYGPLKLRSTIVPAATIGSQLAIPLLLAGLFLGLPNLAVIGVMAFSLAVLFQLITLPVEFNASSRAVEALEIGGYLSRDEVGGAKKVLNAAALTYVAATIMAVMQLLRLLILSGLLGGRRRQ